MNRSRTKCSLPVTLLVLASLTIKPAFAQNNDAYEAARQAEAAAAAAAAQQQALQDQVFREQSQAALRDFLNEHGSLHRIPPSAAADLDTKFYEFRQAIPRFRTATDDFRWNLSLERKLEKPLKDIEAQSDVMLRYLSAAKINHPRPDPLEFKDYSQNELAWETLNSAERIASFLDLAVQVESQDVVSPKMMEFMYKLDGELLRLKWLTSHTR